MNRIVPRVMTARFMLAILTSLLVASGCGDRSTDDAKDSSSSQGAHGLAGPDGAPASSSREADRQTTDLTRIRRLISGGNDSEAKKAIGMHLVRFPRDTDAMVLVSEFYQARGQVDDAVAMLDAAAELSTDGERAWRLRAAKLLTGVRKWPQAITRLEALLTAHEDFDEARHELVSLLNQRGFRFDANEHVRTLCRRGKALPDELRGLMFPNRSVTGLSAKPSVDDTELIRKSGALNVARAMYSEGDVTDASAVMKTSRLVMEKHPAAVAFYGQTLIESQQFDVFGQWLDEVGVESQRYPSYWIAVGGWAMHQRKFDVAVRRFAEAVLREPGDLATNDRMTQALAASAHQKESEEFRRRGVLIDRLMTVTREIFVGARLDPRAVEEISRLLTDAGRPLEALAWYRIVLEKMRSPAEAIRKLDEALAMFDDEEFLNSNRVKLLCGVDLNKFPDAFDLAGSQPTVARAMKSSSKRVYPETIQPSFVNVAKEVGLDFTYYNADEQVLRELRLFEQIGAGVSCLDYDLDGNVDFYLGQASSEPPAGRGSRPNLLARSLGDRFIGVTELAACDDRGYACGITSGDWNQDGFPDLVVANMARNTLFINQGDGTFVARQGDPVWDAPLNTTSLAMGDVDGDHLPDIVEINYVDDPSLYDPIEYKADGTPVHFPAPLDFRAGEDRLFLSRGDGALVGRLLDDREQAAPATGLGVLVTNIDDDLENEIFIANDHLANHLWERHSDDVTGESDWQNTAAARGVAFGASGTPLGCMGIAASDFDENGYLDLHVTNFENEWSNQYMQGSSGFFDDLVVAYGLDQPTYKMLGFGAQAFDYDNNMAMDLVIGNGHVDDYTARGAAFEMPTQVFALEDSRFVMKSVAGDPGYWDSGHLSRALATCDWNNDGRTDFVVTDLKQPFALLENRTETSYRWLQLQLVGTTSERDAIGATVKASFTGRTLTKVVQSGDGYMCRNQSLLAFGLGESDAVDRLEVCWPDGQQQTLTDVAAGHRWLIIQDHAGAFELDR